MIKRGSEAKVKKILVRNIEQKVKCPKNAVVHDMGCTSAKYSGASVINKQNDLNQPSLCSSEALANYLSDVKLSLPSKANEVSNVDMGQLGAKMTKKLNFHFNDRMYKNLIELNGNVDEVKVKKNKTSTNISMKRDLEPNIEDFYQDESEDDIVPVIPILKTKFRPIKKVENGHLHDLIASFEDL